MANTLKIGDKVKFKEVLAQYPFKDVLFDNVYTVSKIVGPMGDSADDAIPLYYAFLKELPSKLYPFGFFEIVRDTVQETQAKQENVNFWDSIAE